MGVLIGYVFDLLKEDIIYPSLSDIIKALQEHTQLKITIHEMPGRLPKMEEKNESEGYELICTSSGVKEALRLYKDDSGRTVSIVKSDNNFTYLFHSLFYTLSKIIFDLEGAYVQETLFNSRCYMKNMNDLVGFYQEVKFHPGTLECAKYPYHKAKKMLGFKKRFTDED